MKKKKFIKAYEKIVDNLHNERFSLHMAVEELEKKMEYNGGYIRVGINNKICASNVYNAILRQLKGQESITIDEE